MKDITSTGLALSAILPLVSAHGYLHKVVVDGIEYEGSNPSWYNQQNDLKLIRGTPSWLAYNQDVGYVDSGSYRNHAITCHKGARAGTVSIPIQAGVQIGFKWDRWPESHHGPALTYLAKCNGSCTEVDSSDLNFFKIDHDGLHNGTAPADGLPGTWATDKLIDDRYTWVASLPRNIEPGQYVLRHELISLHQAFNKSGAQNFPTVSACVDSLLCHTDSRRCINLDVKSTGSLDPCAAGADCRKGTELYSSEDPGILIDIYHGVPNYTIPGPDVWTGLDIPPTKADDRLANGEHTDTQVVYGQCGGHRYIGTMICPEGTSCEEVNEWYWHCSPHESVSGSTSAV